MDSFDDILGKSRFTIYQLDARENMTRSRVDRFFEIRNLLVSGGAKEHEIARLNLSTQADFDLAEYIYKKMNGVTNAKPPFVFYYAHYLGDGDTVQKMFDTGRLQQLISGEISTDTEKFILEGQPPQEEKEETDKPQLRLIDNILEVTEALTSYFNPFAWWRSAPKDDNEPLFCVDVIHTNWYGRNLRRTFKFFPNSYQRVHPNGEVRAIYNYDQVKNIKKKTPATLIIEYEGQSPDWIQASPQDITKIFDQITQRTT